MIEQILKLDDFRKSGRPTYDLRQSVAAMMSTLPQPVISAQDRRVLESWVILKPLDGLLPSPEEMLHPRLTIVAENLTDAAELTVLKGWAESIRTERRQRMESEPRRRFVPSLYVLGGGAEYSERYPYRTPQAQEIRDRLTALGVIFFERPEGLTLEQLRSHMEDLLDRR
jgi:hypothetical protein